MTEPLRWRVREDPPASAARNMAVDHALAVSLPSGMGVLRFYRWAAPTLSFGRNEPTEGRWSTAALSSEGVEVVRRPTGGRAVLHHRELTYAVVVPAGGPGSMRGLYGRVNAALVRALRAFGVAAELAPRQARAAPPDAGPCFELPAEGEVVAGGAKLVGSAQVRLEGRLLQHGSILLADDQHRLGRLAAEPVSVSDGAVTSLERCLGRVPEVAELIEVLRPALAEGLGGDWHCADTEHTLGESLLTRLEAHYRSPTWIWRR
ncbi:biotin/lipoate A/B protein ligase family protein [Gaopeijia maritima]|uniref:lipoate--protein ligase family protein n=1 Tax=Gaopeijia maritima TaxID=3119007 RepID=UPI0032443EB7